MSSFLVDTKESFQDVLFCLQDGAPFKHVKDNLYKLNAADYLEFTKEYKEQLELHDIINGINKETNIVNISVCGEYVYIFKENQEGVTNTRIPYRHWVLAKKKLNETFTPLAGKQPFAWFKEYDLEQFETKIRSQIYKNGMFTLYNYAENFMVRNGHTYFKGMKSTDVSLLSFDIETTGLDPNADDARLLLITNTFRKNNKYHPKTFCIEDYKNEYDMIADWCDWVREKDPSILLGHNIVMFDIPYIKTRANKYGKELVLGRLDEQLQIEEKTRELRKDGSQTYSYQRINCFGREIVDTFFLAIKADIARKYESYGLKSIIKQEGMEEEGRQHYDGALIAKNWHIPEERKKIIAYGENDSRDPIKLFDLMVAPFFYITPYIPKPFQIMVESATGSQLNALMVRSYLQKNMSVAEGTRTTDFEGAISFGNCGVYDDVFKVDVASLYPSIMRHYEIYPKEKDFNNNFLKMLNFFTIERLKNKKLAKDTGDRFFDDLQNAQKVVINSAYGFMSTKGLNYNFPEGAASVTRYGREIITKACVWATGHTLKHIIVHTKNKGKPNEEHEYEWVLGDKVAEGKGYKISNCDTDSISFTCGRALNDSDKKEILDDLNSNFPSAIKFEDDGYYKRIVVLRAKNYILYDGKKVKLKGSSIKDQKKEPALREMMEKLIDCLVFDTSENLVKIYTSYVKEAMNVTDIRRWCAKKTITKAILNCATDPEARENERKPYMAVKDMPGLQEGNKVYLYPVIMGEEIIPGGISEKTGKKLKDKRKIVTGLKLAEAWDHDEDKNKLVERVVDTVEIFASVINTNQFIDYRSVKNKVLLSEL